MTEIYTDKPIEYQECSFRKPQGMPRTRWKRIKEKERREKCWEKYASCLKKNEE